MATDTAQTFVSVGRRKAASARARLSAGSGKITINGREFEDYCYSEGLRRIVVRPLDIVEKRNDFDVVICVQGGGPVGQANAIAHAIARALQTQDETLRPSLKKAGQLKRDPRVKERKKPGQPGARKRFQFSKR